MRSPKFAVSTMVCLASLMLTPVARAADQTAPVPVQSPLEKSVIAKLDELLANPPATTAPATPTPSTTDKAVRGHHVIIQVLSASDTVVATIDLPSNGGSSIEIASARMARFRSTTGGYTTDLQGNASIRVTAGGIESIHLTGEHIAITSISDALPPAKPATSEEAPAKVTTATDTGKTQVKMMAYFVPVQPAAKADIYGTYNGALAPKWEKWENPRLIP